MLHLVKAIGMRYKIFFLSFIALPFCYKGFCKNTFVQKKENNLFFLENKGQLKDQYGHSRTDIQYYIRSAGMTVFIGNGQLHFQFDNTCSGTISKDKNSGTHTPGKTDLYRMDVSLAGAQLQNDIIAEGRQEYHEFHYSDRENKNGIEALAYNKITYKNVYPGIDWALYIKNNKLEYEFILAPSADPSLIKLQYNGQQSLQLEQDGAIVATTPMGIVKDNAPLCYYIDGHAKKSMIRSAFKLTDNTLSFVLANNATGYCYNDKKLVIDPILEWGTYYGPYSSNTYFYDIITDQFANVYGCGLTYGTTDIATVGSYQNVFGGSTDAYLVKFDSSGNRLWATYYGGPDGDWATALAMDSFGCVYMAGSTSSTTGISSTGCDQPAYGGGEWAGFLVKFDTAGNRRWATYLGGSPGSAYDLEISSISCDITGHVYVSGTTDDTSNIATPGSFKPVKLEGADTAIECFLMLYDTAGMKQWGTYYGGPGRNYTLVGANCNDGSYVYLSGYTNDTTSSAFVTTGAYQSALRGNSDIFLAKFTSAGTRVWGTYYGGESSETMSGIAYIPGAGVYIFGTTYSDTNMTSTGCFQPLRAGDADAFIALFSVELGYRVWGTYFGGPGTESSTFGRISVDDTANVYVTGYTNSTSGMATTGAWQTTYGGGSADAFLAKYNSSGTQKWSTYYGGNAGDEGYACAFGGNAVYICGQTNSPDNIATPGSFLSTSPGGAFYYEGFLGKFIDPPAPSLSLAATSVYQSINLFPSPNNGSFTVSGNITAKDLSDVTLTITDIAGRVVLVTGSQVDNGAFSKKIELKNEPSGEYLLKLSCNNNDIVRSFIKQ